MEGTLWLDVQNNRARWNGTELRLKPIRWFGFLVLLSKRFGKGHISADEVAELEGFRGQINADFVGKKIRQYVENSLNPQVGCELVICKPGKSELLFQLNNESVKSIEWSSKPDTAPDISVLERSTPQESIEDLAVLGSIEGLIEAGKLHAAEDALRPLIGVASSTTLVRALLMQSSIALFRNDLQEASVALARAQDSSAGSLNPRLLLLIQLQSARMEYMGGNLEEARIVLQKLFQVVPNKDFALQARLEMMMGLLEMGSGQEPKAARPFFHFALYNALEAKWWWGVQAIYANLGLMWVRQSQHPTTGSNENIRLGYLEMAHTWFERAMSFGTATGLSQNSPELLVWTARVRRELGQVDHTGPLLDEALQMAKQFDSLRSEAEVLLEMGEVAWYLGRRAEARQHWQAVLGLGLPSFEYSQLYNRIQDRVELV